MTSPVQERIQNLLTKIKRQHEVLAASHDQYRTNIKSSLAEDYAQVGHEYYKTSDYESATKYYKRAYEYNPEHYPAINLLGACLLKLGKYKEAIDYFEKTLNGTKYNYEAHLKETAEQQIAYAKQELRDAISRKVYVLEQSPLFYAQKLEHHLYNSEEPATELSVS